VLKPFGRGTLKTTIEIALTMHRMDQSLREQEAWLQTILTSIGDGVIATDADGRIRFLNQAAQGLTGWHNETAVGKELSEVFRVEDEDQPGISDDPVRRVSQEQLSCATTASARLLTTKVGAKTTIEYGAGPIRGADGGVNGVVVVARDITERRLFEHDLKLAHKLDSIGSLAGGIAHDFNNLLTTILGNASYVADELGEGHELFEAITGIVESGRLARSLTQQLLTFAQGGEPLRKPHDLRPLVRSAARFATGGKPVNCVFEFAEDLYGVEVDQGQMTQVVSNLVLNAVQTMVDGGTIRLALTNVDVDEGQHGGLSQGQYVRLTVSDEGEGIPRDQLAKVFEPYFSTKPQGSGLGLAIVYSVVKRHAGRVDVESAVGQGTTFSVFLPRTTAAVVPTEQAEVPAPCGQARVLIMDDQGLILDLATRVLKRLGYQATVARDGRKAIELYREAHLSGRPFDVVILDLTVAGGMGGVDAVAELVKIDPQVKAIASSGYATDPVMAKPKEYGFVGILPKPYSIRLVGQVLAEVVGVDKSTLR
jgi:PAS domain S-box-containing protein